MDVFWWIFLNISARFSRTPFIFFKCQSSYKGLQPSYEKEHFFLKARCKKVPNGHTLSLTQVTKSATLMKLHPLLIFPLELLYLLNTFKESFWPNISSTSHNIGIKFGTNDQVWQECQRCLIFGLRPKWEVEVRNIT